MPILQDDDFWVKRLDRLEAKQDRILDTQTETLLKIGHNTEVLVEHQRRSAANEAEVRIAHAKLEAMRAWAAESIEKLKADLAVHNAARAARSLVLKWVGAIIGAAAGITGILKLILGL